MNQRSASEVNVEQAAQMAGSIDAYRDRCMDAGVCWRGRKWSANEAAQRSLIAASNKMATTNGTLQSYRRDSSGEMVAMDAQEVMQLASIVTHFAFRCRLRAWQLKARLTADGKLSPAAVSVGWPA